MSGKEWRKPQDCTMAMLHALTSPAACLVDASWVAANRQTIDRAAVLVAANFGSGG